MNLVYFEKNTERSRFHAFRIYVKSLLYIEKFDDEIKNLLNNESPFYVISRFYIAFAADQQYRKIEN